MPPLKRGSSMIRANLKNLRNAKYFLSCKNKKEFHKHKLKQLLVASCFSYTANFSWAKALPFCPSEWYALNPTQWPKNVPGEKSTFMHLYKWQPSHKLYYLSSKNSARLPLHNFSLFNREGKVSPHFILQIAARQAGCKTAHSGLLDHLKVAQVLAFYSFSYSIF